MLEGEVELALGPERQPMRATPGDFAAAPPDVVHAFRNASDASAIFLNIHAPSSGFGDVLRGRGESGFDQHDPPPDGGRPFADAVFTRPGDAETLEHDASTHRIVCDLPQLTAIEMTFRPEFEGVDAATHDDHADCFYVLEGEVEFLVGDEPRLAGPGTFVAAPPHAVHGFRVAGGKRPVPQPARSARRIRRPLARERLSESTPALGEPAAPRLVVEDDGVLAGLEHDLEVAADDRLLRPPAVDDAPLLAHERDRLSG